jgi:hypothetical protein
MPESSPAAAGKRLHAAPYLPSSASVWFHCAAHGCKKSCALNALFRCGSGTRYASFNPSASATGFHSALFFVRLALPLIFAPSSPQMPPPPPSAYSRSIFRRPANPISACCWLMPACDSIAAEFVTVNGNFRVKFGY